MNQEDWEDLLHDLTSDILTTDEKRDQCHKLAAHMAELENELHSLKKRVGELEKGEDECTLDFDAYELQP